MRIIDNIMGLRATVEDWRAQGLRIGFVPTMGNLHAGHLALVEKAARLSDRVVVSVFVNPLQFDDAADLAAYPRTLAVDQEKLRTLNVDVVFAPDEHTLYPDGRETITRVEVPDFSGILEGAARPGHFSGVATVVTKLFHCVQPHLAVFGEKDFQQLLLIRRMVRDLNMPVDIIAHPTERESDGLALSSRNSRLSPNQREQAPALHKTLISVGEKVQTGCRDYQQLEQDAIKSLKEQGVKPDYVAIRDAGTLLEPAERCVELVILIAAHLGNVRLIDNLRVDLTS